MRTVRRLLFVETAQGTTVVRPSLRDVAAWLALRQGWVFDRLCAVDPSILLDLGDPGSLTGDQRRRALNAYIDRYGVGGWRGLDVPRIQVRRFASSDLGSLIAERFACTENVEVRQLLLQVVEAAQLTDCAAIARGVVRDAKADLWERFHALLALISLDDAALPDIAASIAQGDTGWPPKLVRLALQRLFPKFLPATALVDTLRWLPETKSTGETLGYTLPPLITEAQLDAAQLKRLREGLHALVADGLTFDKRLHCMASVRPHLVPALAAVCVRLLMAEQMTSAGAGSIALAAILGRETRGDDLPHAELAAAIASAPSAVRQALFGHSVALTRSVRPTLDILDMAHELRWRGVVALVEGDRAWVLARLGDRETDLDERAALLAQAMYELAPEDEAERTQYLQALQPLIADDAPLSAQLAERMQPYVQSREHRRMVLCNERRKRQTQRREAKSVASWVAFRRQLENNPDAAFGPDRAIATVRNLLRLMRHQTSSESLGGWNRTLIEQHLGHEVADRLQAALAGLWRRDLPALGSERSDEDGWHYDRWRSGLAGIAAEAEDADWATRLTSEDAERAARYAPLQLNGFPAWLPALAAAHPTVVERVLGGELAHDLAGPAQQHSYPFMLQRATSSTPDVARLFLPRLRAWLAATGGLPAEGEHLDGVVARLERVLAAIDAFGTDDDRADIAARAVSALRAGGNELLDHVWLPALFTIEPAAATERLEALCADVPVSRESKAVAWIAQLFGRHARHVVDFAHPGFDADLLLRLTRFAYRHVDRADDRHHEGMFSPDTRDDAETGRNALLSALLATSGADGWRVKLELAADPELAHLRDRLHALAVDASAREADGEPFSDDDVAGLALHRDPGARTTADMAAVLRDRLDDTMELLLTDASPRELWSTITDEKLMRRTLAATLQQLAAGGYVVAQEGVTAEEKEMDLRLVSTSAAVTPPQEAAIELKLGDDRSGRDLRDTIRNQLLAKYLAPDHRRAGALVVTCARARMWDHPDTGERLDFAGLIAMLEDEARAVMAAAPDALFVLVAGYDLTPRIATEAQARRVRKGIVQRTAIGTTAQAQ